MKELRVKRETLAEQISDALVDSIMDGTIAMGARLRTQDLADQFGVSRMPVREALIGLQGTGLVEAAPYSGYTVASLDKDRIREIYIIRKALEPLVARTAVANLSAEKLDAITQRFTELEEATLAEVPSPKRIYIKNREFHFSLYECSNLPHVVDVIRSAWDHLAVYKLIYGRKYIDDKAAGRRMVEEHRAILNALQDGDTDLVAELLEERIAEHEIALPDEFDK